MQSGQINLWQLTKIVRTNPANKAENSIKQLEGYIGKDHPKLLLKTERISAQYGTHTVRHPGKAIIIV